MITEFLSEASDEALLAKQYYDRQLPGLGNEFRNELEKVLQLIEAHPNAWSPMGNGLRACQLGRFPYAVIYRVKDQRVLILAIAHAKRRPGYWQSRDQE